MNIKVTIAKPVWDEFKIMAIRKGLTVANLIAELVNSAVTQAQAQSGETKQ